jgi:hypothetical protein
MPKGQKRGNREIRKPKAVKPAGAVPASTLLTKGTPRTQTGFPKKKG